MKFCCSYLSRVTEASNEIEEYFVRIWAFSTSTTSLWIDSEIPPRNNVLHQYATTQDQDWHVKYVTDHCPNDCIIVFDGYSGDLSTNLPNNSDEQRDKHLPIIRVRETWKSLATRMLLSTTRTARSHPAYIIHQLGPLEQFINCKKHTGNTDSLIASTTLSVENEMKQPVV